MHFQCLPWIAEAQQVLLPYKESSGPHQSSVTSEPQLFSAHCSSWKRLPETGERMTALCETHSPVKCVRAGVPADHCLVGGADCLQGPSLPAGSWDWLVRRMILTACISSSVVGPLWASLGWLWPFWGRADYIEFVCCFYDFIFQSVDWGAIQRTPCCNES